MNIIATSKEEILQTCRELIRQQKGTTLNVRQVASACGVSVGTVYNYFDSKADLVGAAVESVWNDIFRCEEQNDSFSDILSCIRWMFARMEYGSRQYPGFFVLHSMSFAQQGKSDGKQRMQKTWQHMCEMLCAVLRNDANVRSDAFDDSFTPEMMADLLFSLLLAASMRCDFSCDAVLQIARRTLY